MQRFGWDRRSRRGSAQVEFALCAIFMVFLLISIFDMARGLWIYVTVAEAVRDGTRYAAVRGANYVNPANMTRLTASPTGATVGDTVKVVQQAATGLVPSQLNVKLTDALGTIDCSPSTTCAGSGTIWPRDGAADLNLEIGINVTYPYNSMVVMFFPGGKGIQFGKYVLGSTSRQRIVF
jgi:Flp pilus assembly protein TadG